MTEKMQKNELDYIKDIRVGALTATEEPTSRILTVLLTLLLLLLLWAYFFSIDEVTKGHGKVIPSSKIQNIQSLEGGIIAEVAVKESEQVKKGQLLIKLDDTQYLADRGAQLANYHSLMARAARLHAEVERREEIFWPQAINNLEGLKSRETNVFNSRIESFNSKVKFLDQRIKLLKDETTMLAPLVERGIMSQVDFNRLQQNLLQLQGERKEFINKYFELSNNELNNTESELTAIKENLASIEDKIARSTITSPVDGIVKVINISSKGEIIHTGINIMEIVPQDDSLLIEAQINPQNIGFISPNQEVIVKVSAYDFAIYGGLPGELQQISADTMQDDQGNYHYLIKVRTNKNYLEKDGNKFHIIPGMTVEVDILTGKRSILSFILKPIIRGFSGALGER